MSLKERTVKGIIWSFLDSFSSQIITFVVGIILARLLEPQVFGLVGMITIFIAVSETFIGSGFGSALIRKSDCSQTDYSTVFLFNLGTGIFFFFLLFILAQPISGFFNEAQLTSIIRVLSLVLIIDSLSIVQRTILTKNIDFRLQARISVISGLLAGAISILMAFKGWGVWSLVAKTLIQRTMTTMLLWFWNKWKPTIVFSTESFRQLFGFGSRLLASGLIDTLYRNIYYLIIGKFFSSVELGYFTRAERFKALPSETISNVVLKVSYPVLSNIGNDSVSLKAAYVRLIKSTMLITFILMIGLAAIARPMTIILIGEKWLPSVIYLQMLCFVGILYPLQSLNLNILLVHGRSDLGLRLEIIKKVFAIPVIVAGIIWGIKVMIAGMMVNSLIAYWLNSYWSGKLIAYPVKEQISDILPSFGVAAFTGLIVFLTGLLLSLSYLGEFTIQVLLGGITALLICELTRLEEYCYLKGIVKSAFKKL